MWPHQGPLLKAATWLGNLLMLQSYAPAQVSVGYWFAPAWSVSCEATFYLAFPPLLWQMRRAAHARGRSPPPGRVVWLATLPAVGAAVWALRHFHSPLGFTERFVYAFPGLRIMEFAVAVWPACGSCGAARRRCRTD